MLLKLNPYLTHYRSAFASSSILYPQPYRLASRLAFPAQLHWEDYGLTMFRVNAMNGEGPACSPVTLHLRQKKEQLLCLSHLPFGSSLSAPLACPD